MGFKDVYCKVSLIKVFYCDTGVAFVLQKTRIKSVFVIFLRACAPCLHNKTLLTRAFLAGNKGKEFRSCALVISETSQHDRGFHLGILLLNTAHHHAHMLGFDDNPNP